MDWKHFRAYPLAAKLPAMYYHPIGETYELQDFIDLATHGRKIGMTQRQQVCQETGQNDILLSNDDSMANYVIMTYNRLDGKR